MLIPLGDITSGLTNIIDGPLKKLHDVKQASVDPHKERLLDCSAEVVGRSNSRRRKWKPRYQ